MRTLITAPLLLALAATPLLGQGIGRVTLDTAGGDSDGDSTNRALSGDGRYVAFASTASDLDAGDGNGLSDIFVCDRIAGTTVRVSVDTAGGDANGASTAPAISADGLFVAFVSGASDLVAGDGNAKQDIFLRDLVLGTTTRISVDSAGGDSNGDSSGPWLDGDGDVVAFASSATDLVAGDTNKWQDIFVRDLVSGVTTRVSVTSAGVQANNKSSRATLSHDGMLVAFSSSADNLVASDGNNRADVFVHDRAAGTTIRASVNDNGWGGNGNSGDPEISGDGTKVVFDSFADNLVSSDFNYRQDVFLRDLVAGTTTRVSVDAAGNEGDDDSYEASLNDDGSIVTFSSEAANLVANDLNGVTDVFTRHLLLSVNRRLSVSNLGAEADANCRQPEISADGQVITFESAATSLDPNDGNGLVDIFSHSTCEVRFVEFGNGLAGTGGFVPHLYGDGGTSFFGADVHIRDGIGFGHGLLWIGFGTTDVPLFGGRFYLDLAQFFVPLPVLLEGVVDQPGQGSLDLNSGDVTAYFGLTVYLQLALIDPGAVRGVSLSNGLEMDLISR